jgi:uncharacterized membrane protein
MKRADWEFARPFRKLGRRISPVGQLSGNDEHFERGSHRHHSSGKTASVRAQAIQSIITPATGWKRKRRGRPTTGERVADAVAGTMGSWAFIIVQSVILLVWIAATLVAIFGKWDPHPFILLNLALSFQAAYAAPFIMMSQNRQQNIDRNAAENDFRINVKAELEIELLHEKIDRLRAEEISQLVETVKCLTTLLESIGVDRGKAPGQEAEG